MAAIEPSRLFTCRVEGIAEMRRREGREKKGKGKEGK